MKEKIVVTVLDCLRVKKLFYLMIPGHVTWARRRITKFLLNPKKLHKTIGDGTLNSTIYSKLDLGSSYELQGALTSFNDGTLNSTIYSKLDLGSSYELQIMCVLTTIMLLGLHNVSEARALEGEKWLWKGKNYVVFHSLQRGPVNDSQKNPCSAVPGRSKGHCTSSDMNIDGYVIADDTKIKGLGKLAKLEKHLHFQK
ncbi:unnamed protein product [Lupinus luteus]|uniref:Uncharacterized protein n=1 Tax=Lupinus luteus TaxID=3873 RepID=A0AAV1X0H7_LUPLU